MIGVCFVYTGLIAVFLGAVSVLKPLSFLGIHSRSRGATLLLLGFGVVIVGWLLPAREVRINAAHNRLDEFIPVYQFHEFHTIEVAASRQQVAQAIKAVTADEISLFRTLIWIRRFGRKGPEDILNPPRNTPILDVATRTTFILLAEEPEREMVFGTLIGAPQGWHPQGHATPEGFKNLHDPGFALAAMNFAIEETKPGLCSVTTETRVYATDSASRRRFAAYWRTIYPGSALIRRMWLRAIKHRAESMQVAAKK